MATTFQFDPWHYVPRARRGELRAWALAIAMHALLALGLLMHVDWHSQQPEAIEAEIWASLPVAAGRPSPTPEEVLPPKFEPKPEPVVEPKVTPTPIKPDIALPDKKPKIEPKIEKKPEPKVAPKPQPVVDNSAQKKAEALKEKQRQEELNRLFGKAGQEAKGNDANSTANRSQGSADANFAGLVKACIRPQIRMPNTLSGNPEVVYRLALLPSGEQTAVNLVKSSGQQGWDDAVERAIRRCDPLPRPKQGSMPRSLELSFKPQEDTP